MIETEELKAAKLRFEIAENRFNEALGTQAIDEAIEEYNAALIGLDKCRKAVE